MLAFFTLGAFGWWLVSAGAIITVCLLVENMRWWWSMLSVAIYLCFLQWLGNVDIGSSVIHHPYHTLWCVLVYFLCGLIWSWAKWVWYLLSVKEKRQKAREEFVKNYKPFKSSVPEDMRVKNGRVTEMEEKWQNKVQYDELEKPEFRKNKNRIAVWVTYWPISVVNYCLNDLVRKIVNTLITFFRKIYEKISDTVFKGVE